MQIALRNIFFICSLMCCSYMAIAADDQLMGGYHSADVNDPGVRRAAQFAAQEINQGLLSKVITADTQVVAGINYSMLLEITAADGTTQTYKVIVFVPLPVEHKPMQLMLWSKEPAPE